MPVGKIWGKEMKSVRWTVNAEISVGGQISALGEQVGVFVDVQTNRPIRMPEQLMKKYREFFA